MVPLPPYARRIEYLESTGTQWLDTGVNADSGLGCEIDVAFIDSSMNVNATFGDLKRDSGSFVRYHPSFDTNRTRLTMYLGQGTTAAVYADTSPGQDFHSISVDTVGQTASIDGTSAGISSIGTWDTGMSFTLFARSDSNGTVLGSSQRVRKAVFRRSGTPVRSFVPCRILGTGYLWDEVEGRLYGNRGTGDFVLGPDVREGCLPGAMCPMGISRRMSDVPYSEDGAVMILDGIFNVGAGRHSSASSTTSWKDLAGRRDATLTRASNGWTDTSLNTKALTGGTASTVAAAAFPGVPFAENTTVEMVFRVDQAQNANGEVAVFAGGYDRFCFSFVSGGTAGSLVIATTPDTRIGVDMSDPGVDSDICDLGKVHNFCVVFGESDSLTGWSLYHNGSVQPLYVRGGNVGLQSDGTGTVVGRTNSVSVPNNANGQILAFRVYNRALTQAEISNHWLVDRDRFGIGKRLRVWGDGGGSSLFDISTPYPLAAGNPVTGTVNGDARSGILDSNLYTVNDAGGNYVGEFIDLTPGGTDSPAQRWFDTVAGYPLLGYCEIGWT